ncbi:hypothetical protein PF006_g12024 [Phytophthora fragariae]|uniref:RING-type domain-containing protein n=1 Tax=Phytophthora fragariae TaxID=53985 RepID=A0A6A3TUK6_9STRA|nr:hypothetical protein PF006_g12024 [Phytophthora fragariae]
MAQGDDADSGGDSGHHAGERSATTEHTAVETPAMTPVPVSSSQTPSAPRDNLPNVSVSEPPPALYDALPRPHSIVQRSTSDAEMERRTPYDPALRGFVGRSNSASLDPENAPEGAELQRQRLLAATLSTPVSGDAVSSRLLQALPQLAIGQFLQDFNNQTPSWRNFTAAGRQDSTASEDNTGEEGETGRLLPAQPSADEGRQGSPPRSRRRASSMFSMSASGEFERSDGGEPRPPGAGDVDSAPAALPTVRVDSGGRARRNSEDESDDQTAMDELQALFRRCHNSLPFAALFLVYFAYQHATGILVFVVGTVAVMGLDQRMRAQVALKDKPNPLHHFSQILQSRSTHSSDGDSGLLSSGGIFWQVLCTVLVNDFLVRLWSIVVKAFVAGAKSDRFQCRRKYQDDATASEDQSAATVSAGEGDDSSTTITPLTQQAVSTVAFYRRKRKLYGIIEMCSIFVRSLLASIPWCSFYQLCASKFMADVFTFAYLFIKCLILATQGRRIFILTRSLVTLGLEFGAYVTHDELVEAGSPDCSICYEAMRQPVKLACSHMFCEECVTEWFDHERSCPLCRASVGSGPTDEENVKPQFLDGRTSLVPQLL